MFTSPDDFKDREVTLTRILTITPEKDDEAWYSQMFADAANYDDLFIVKYAQLEKEIVVDTYIIKLPIRNFYCFSEHLFRKNPSKRKANGAQL